MVEQADQLAERRVAVLEDLLALLKEIHLEQGMILKYLELLEKLTEK